MKNYRIILVAAIFFAVFSMATLGYTSTNPNAILLTTINIFTIVVSSVMLL